MKDSSFKNFSYIAVGRVISAVLTSVFYLVFATILQPTDYGEMGYLVALAVTFSIVARFGLPQTIVVYRSKGDTILSRQLNLLALIFVSAASIILLFINEFSAFLCIGLSFFFLYQYNLLGEKRYKSFMKITIFRNVLIVLIPFPLYFVLGIPGILLGMGIANLISGLWALKFTSFKIKSLYLLKSNFKIIINNFGIDASTGLIRTVDRLFVGTIFGFAFVGFYILNMQILFALEILPRVLYLFLLSEESAGQKHKKISYLVVLASGLIAITMIIFSPLLIETFFPNYSDSILSIQILVVSLIPVTISLIITAKLQARESIKVGYSAIVSVGSLLLLLGFLGNLYGLIGLSISVLISSILNALVLYFTYHNSETVKKN